MNKRSLLILFVLLMGQTAYADELITDFEETSVVILNEELRLLREQIAALEARITALEP